MDPILNTQLDFSSPFSGTPAINADAYGRTMVGQRAYTQDPVVALERNLKDAQERYDAIRQQRAPMMQRYQPPTSTPIWDEISRIQDSLSSNQMRYIESIPEYAESFNTLAVILNREYMKLMRPIVEATPDGKAALQKHLEIVNRLVKQAKDDADQQAMLVQDYTQHYSHLTFEQYLKLKRGEESSPSSRKTNKVKDGSNNRATE